MDTFEKIAYQEGYQLIAGIDEAAGAVGRTCCGCGRNFSA